jgi:voltage-gated potassium channel
VTAAREPVRQRTNGWRRIYGERRFGVLLAVLAALLMLPPILLGFGVSAEWFDALLSLLVLAGILSLCFEPRQRLFSLLVGVPSVLFSIGGHAFSGETSKWVLFAGHLCQVLFLLGAAVLIVRSMFGSGTLTFDSIAGAVCGYLFLGLGWAVIYSMIESFRPGSFEAGESLISGEDSTPRQVLTYFSFVTLTTVGYGDVLPVTPVTRTCAWIEAITGQFYLAVIVAGLVSMLVTSRVLKNED